MEDIEKKSNKKNEKRSKDKDLEKVSEAKVEKEVIEENNSNINKKKRKTIIVTLSIILVFSLIGLIMFIFRDDIYSFTKEKLGISPKEKLELKYTETSDTDIKGVYITDVSEVVENTMPSIVAITSKTLISSGYFGFNFEKEQEGAGSGIIISESDNDIMILTNNHVIEGSSELSVQFINEKSYDARVIGSSERKDIAVIAVSKKNIDSETLKSIKIATMGNSDELKVGNGIIAIGNALGYGQSVTTGVVSALNREVSIDNYTNKMIQIDAAINGGNSGGALLNSKGEVVGINSAKYSSNVMSSNASIEGMGFAIPISQVKDLITKLMNGKEDSSPTIGVEGYIVTEQYGRAYNMPIGFCITKIISGSGADKANLEIGNIITKINGKKVENSGDLQDVLYKLNKGDKVTLTISYVNGREYKEKEVTVVLS